MKTALAVVHPPEASGLHTFWAARWVALRERGVEIHLAVPPEVVSPALRDIPAGCVHELEYGRPRSAVKLAANLRYLARLGRDSRAIAELAAQVGSTTLVSHGPHLVTPAVAARRHHLRHVVLLHSDAAPGWSATLLGAIRRPDQVLAETSAAARKYGNALGARDLDVLLPAVHPRFGAHRDGNGRLPARTALEVDGDRPVLGFVGVFSPRKRPDRVLDLAEALHAAGQPWAVRLIGEVAVAHTDWFERNVGDRIRRLRAEQVDIALVPGRDGVSALMPGIDCLVITSANEGVPNVCMEALAVGTPVVALALPGLDGWDERVNAAAGATVLVQVGRGHGETSRLADAAERLRVPPADRAEIATAGRAVFAADAAADQLSQVLAYPDRVAVQ